MALDRRRGASRYTRMGRHHRSFGARGAGRCMNDLIREIDQTLTATPTLWWLGHSGFIVRFANITFYVDPCFSDFPDRPRLLRAPLSGKDVRHADMILSTHAPPGHLDAASIRPMLQASPRAKLVIP